jgi:hypothetical protein
MSEAQFEPVGEEALEQTGNSFRRHTIGSKEAIRVQRFFESMVKTADVIQKPFRGEWDKARKAYEGDVEKNVLSNMWRSKVDTQAAYMDSDVPRVRFYPAEASAVGTDMETHAKCDEAVNAYIFREQHFRRELGYVRHSADLTGVGFCVVRPDQTKGMPELVHLENEQVAVDPDAKNRMERAAWVAYCEAMSPEQLKELYPDVPIRKFNEVSGRPAEMLADELDSKIDPMDSGYFNRCKVWRIYSRNQAAMYDAEPAYDKESQPEHAAKIERFKDNPLATEPRRYVLLVEGMDGPLIDMDGWPDEFLCDDDEWPVMRLCYTENCDNVYGVTDYRHERALVQGIEDVLQDMIEKCSIEGLKLGGSEATRSKQDEINTFLSKKGVQFLSGIVDELGKPLVSVLDFKGLSQQDLTLLDTLIAMYDQVAMQPRAARGAESPGKTATATQIENDRQAARATVRLRKFEELISSASRLTMQMAHVMMPQMTRIYGKYGPVALATNLPLVNDVGVALDLNEENEYDVAWDIADKLMREHDYELINIGVEAIAGLELAATWQDWPEQASPGYKSLVLRGVRVNVERGSTQRSARMQKVSMFREVFAEMILPVATATGDMKFTVEAIEKVLDMMDINEFDKLVSMLKTAVQNPAVAPPTPGALPAGPPSDHQAGGKQVTDEEMLNAEV